MFIAKLNGMSRLFAIIVSMLFASMSYTENIYSAIHETNSSTVKLRAAYHSDFLRIVFEGPASIINRGKVSRQGNEILVNFHKAVFTIQEEKMPVAYRINKSTVIVALEKASESKVFYLAKPNRLVIDAYHKETKKGKVKEKETESSAMKSAIGNKYHDHTAEKEEVKKNETEDLQDSDDEDFVPEEYKKLWTLMDSGNTFGVLAVLPEYKPKDVKSLAVYHYLYGRASHEADKSQEAVKHLRLAYIYGANSKLKELALLKRAEIYLKAGLIPEARADYIIFIRNFPSSEHIEKAHLGLANCLSEIEIYNKAIIHYEKAGNNPEALYGKANALQKLGSIIEAEKAYAEAMHADNTYPEASPETYFLMGENMRMSGKRKEARMHLSRITYGPFKGNAGISLGLIAMEEHNTEEAVRHFTEVAQSRDRKSKVQALFNLALAQLKAGRSKDSIASLKEIRHNHINSNLYRDTLLVLSKLYRKEGELKESIALLKELVYGKQPPHEAFSEFETIMLESGEKSGEQTADDLPLIDLWNEVGQWLLHTSREEFLLEIAGKLRNEGRPFLNISSWLVENGSDYARGKAAIDLSDYYIGSGNIEIARKYMNIARQLKQSDDALLRVEAKLHRAMGDYSSSLKKMMSLKKFEKEDIELIGIVAFNMSKANTGEAQEAVAFYEKILNQSEWEAEEYIRLADILRENKEMERALKYYRIAHMKNPEDEWATYRIGRDSVMPESKDMFSKLEKVDTLLGRVAKTRLMEMNLLNKVKKVF